MRRAGIPDYKAGLKMHPLMPHERLALSAQTGVAVEPFTTRFRSTWRWIPGESRERLKWVLTGNRLQAVIELVATWPDDAARPGSTTDTPFGAVAEANRWVAYCGPALELLPSPLARIAIAEPLAYVAAASVLEVHPFFRDRANERPVEAHLRDRFGFRPGDAELRVATEEALRVWGFRPEKLTAWLNVAGNRERLDEALLGRPERR